MYLSVLFASSTDNVRMTALTKHKSDMYYWYRICLQVSFIWTKGLISNVSYMYMPKWKMYIASPWQAVSLSPVTPVVSHLLTLCISVFQLPLEWPAPPCTTTPRWWVTCSWTRQQRVALVPSGLSPTQRSSGRLVWHSHSSKMVEVSNKVLVMKC